MQITRKKETGRHKKRNTPRKKEKTQQPKKPKGEREPKVGEVGGGVDGQDGGTGQSRVRS